MKDPDNVAIMAAYLLGDAKKNAPFYWLEWNEDEEGTVQRKVR